MVGRPNRGSDVSFGYIAITALNYVVRPVLVKWHPLLLHYESNRNPSISQIEYESRWPSADALRQGLNDVRSEMIEYANLLAEVANVPTLFSEARAQQ